MAATQLRYREKLLQQHVKGVERCKRKLAKKGHKARMVRARAVKTEREVRGVRGCWVEVM